MVVVTTGVCFTSSWVLGGGGRGGAKGDATLYVSIDLSAPAAPVQQRQWLVCGGLSAPFRHIHPNDHHNNTGHGGVLINTHPHQFRTYR